jgi:hypothetical protein
MTRRNNRHLPVIALSGQIALQPTFLHFRKVWEVVSNWFLSQKSAGGKFGDAILLNIAAAIIFWIFFAWIPERRRRHKLRPKLELGIYQVYSALFRQFDAVMRTDIHSPSAFQKEIKAKALSAEDIELGLQNKCLNESFRYDENVNRFLIVVGKEMLEERGRVDRNIDRVFAFSSYLTTNEILLLEKIRGKLETYDLGREAAVRIGDRECFPIDPSLSYMTVTVADLYRLFIQLQAIVFHNKYEDRDIVLDKIQCFYEQGQYRRCKRVARTSQTKYPNDRVWLEFYLFLCEYKSNDRHEAMQRLERILQTRPHLVSSRGFLVDVMLDQQIREILKRHYTTGEITEFDDLVRKELEEKNSLIEQAKDIREYVRQKANRR